ncbi:MAG: flippase-like domain-containing protein [Candidatus Cloacimonetes bacterium]|nr:flippase-like domain-containing protein [Candidatus Cloacimonadota bacterium]
MKFNKKLILKTIFTILFLIFLFYFVKPNQIIQALKQAKFFWILLAFLLLPLNLFIQFLRWKFLVVLSNENVPNSEIIKSILYSFSYSIFTPARLGEIGRAFHIQNSKKDELVILAFVEKFFAFGSLLLFGFLSLGIFKTYLFFIIVILIIFILVESKMIVKFIPFIQRYKRVIRRVKISKIFSISIIFVFIYIFQFFLVLNAFHIVQFFKSFFMISIVMFFNSLPITLSGLGIRELLSVYFFKDLGISPASAASASLIIFFINILIPTFVGFGLHIFGKKNV